MPKFDYLLDPDRKARWAKRISEAKTGAHLPKMSVAMYAQHEKLKGAGKECCCPTCGKTFRQGRQKNQRFCSENCCKRQGQALKTSNPFEHRIWSMSNNLLLKDRKNVVRRLIGVALGTKCPYCGTLLMLENVSLDHKEPIGARVFRLKQAMHHNERRESDRVENLHIVCRKCNALKGALNHEQFLKLLEFLSQDDSMKEIVLMRLRRAAVVFGKR